VSPLGVGEDAFFAALDAGNLAAMTDADGLTVARVGDFGAKQQIAPGQLRRLPRLSQMAIVAGKEALAKGAPTYDATRIGVVLGTGMGAGPVGVLFHAAAGQLCLVLGVALVAGGMAWMNRIVRSATVTV